MVKPNKTILLLPILFVLGTLNASTQNQITHHHTVKTKDRTNLGQISPNEIPKMHSLSLVELLKTARENNADLKSIQAKWEAFKLKVPQATSLPDPKLTYGYFIEEVQTKTGPQEQKIGITQSFPWFGKLSLKGKIAYHNAEVVFQEYQNKLLLLTKEIKSVYYEYTYLHDAIKLNQQHLELLKGIESVASIRFKAGKLPQNILIQIQVEQGKLEDRIKELTGLKVPLSSKIYALLSSPYQGILPWPEKTYSSLPDVDLRYIKNKILIDNPNLKRLELLKNKETYRAELAKKSYLPDINIGLESTNVDGGADPTVLMVSINLPIWHDRIEASVQEAIEQKIFIEEEKQGKEQKLQAQFDLLSYYYDDARRKTLLYQNSLIPKAKQAIDIAVKGFEAGNVAYSELLDAERTLLEFQLTKARQLANTWIKVAELDALFINNKQSLKGE